MLFNFTLFLYPEVAETDSFARISCELTENWNTFSDIRYNNKTEKSNMMFLLKSEIE